MSKCCSESDRRHGLLPTGDDENNVRARAKSAQSLLLIEMIWLDGLGQSFPCFYSRIRLSSFGSKVRRLGQFEARLYSYFSISRGTCTDILLPINSVGIEHLHLFDSLTNIRLGWLLWIEDNMGYLNKIGIPITNKEILIILFERFRHGLLSTQMQSSLPSQ
jgi:hypothetical protein